MHNIPIGTKFKCIKAYSWRPYGGVLAIEGTIGEIIEHDPDKNVPIERRHLCPFYLVKIDYEGIFKHYMPESEIHERWIQLIDIRVIPQRQLENNNN